MTTLSPPTAPVIPIRALAYDGDRDFIVERAPNPPTVAAQRFRSDAAPVAARVSEHVRVARDLLAGAALDVSARAAIGTGLQRAVTELRELAESYDVMAVADVCRAREAGAVTLDARAVAGIEHVVHGLLGAAAARAPEPAPESAPEPTVEPAVAAVPPTLVAESVPPAPFRPPTGPALVELLEHGITGIARFPGTPLDMPAVPATPIEGIVPVEQLCYRGRAALDRARAVRDELRATPGAPDPDLLDELYDLLDLATLA